MPSTTRTNLDLTSPQMYREMRKISNQVLSGNAKWAALAFYDVYGYTLEQIFPDRPRLAEEAGISLSALSECINFFTNRGLWKKEMKQVRDKSGKKNALAFFTPTPQFYDLPNWEPAKLRGHGGNSYTCKYCDSEHVRIQKKVKVVRVVECLNPNCKAVYEDSEREFTSSMNTDERKLKGIIAEAKKMLPESGSVKEKSKKDATRLAPQYKPNRGGTNGQKQKRTNKKPPCLVFNTIPDEVLEYLSHMITSEKAIVMQRSGDDKYKVMGRPATLDDIRRHYENGETIGTFIANNPASTWIVIADADNETDWEILKETARRAAAAGYKPLLESSPAGRGGHLVIAFGGPVDSRAVRQHLIKLNPDFERIEEYWPGNRNRVRLPGGKYVYNGIDEWCSIINADGEQLSRDGVGNAKAIFENQTTPTAVPAYVPETRKTEKMSTKNSDKCRKTNKKAAGVDEYHEKKYKDNSFMVAFVPSQMAGHLDRTRKVKTLMTIDSNGYGIAEWRGERTGSVAIYPDNTWADFGAKNAVRENGFDGGDVTDLLCRIHGSTRSEVLREAGKEFRRDAENAIMKAARTGTPIPEWIGKYSTITDRGWNYYRNQCRTRPVANARQEVAEKPVVEEDESWMEDLFDEADS